MSGIEQAHLPINPQFLHDATPHQTVSATHSTGTRPWPQFPALTLTNLNTY